VILIVIGARNSRMVSIVFRSKYQRLRQQRQTNRIIICISECVALIFSNEFETVAKINKVIK